MLELGMMKTLCLLLLTPFVHGYVLVGSTEEDARIKFLVDLIALNVKNNGWDNFITFGNLPNSYYNKIKVLPFTFITSNVDEEDLYVEDAVPYHSNIIIIDCYNFTNFEESLRKVMSMPYWHPHSNVIILYNQDESKHQIAKMLFSLWFYRASNAIFVQHDEKSLYITLFNPFVVDFQGDIFGCRTASTVKMPVRSFDTGLVCEEKCHNVSINTKHRQLHLGTCIGLQTHRILYHDRKYLTELNLFEDRAKNLNGFALSGLATNVPPFLSILKLGNGTYKLGSRDGKIWENLSQLMNFTIDLSACEDTLHKQSIQLNIQQVFTVAHRKADLFLPPIYQFHVTIVEIDYSFPYKDSGVCFVAHKAPFETISFNVKTLQQNFGLILQYHACFLCIWLIFYLYSVLETGKFTTDEIGKNFLNTLRCAISISLHKPSERQSFRYFLTVVLWSFFVINFTMQAAITSIFAASRRGKEVDTYADVVEKGYTIYGIPTPDVVLPGKNKLFQKINSKLKPMDNMFSCVEAMNLNNSQRFCAVDCSVGRYMERNFLDAKGEQYLHVAKDRIHSYYLNFVFPKHSVYSESVDRYLMMFFEAGLVKKWEDYRFNDIKAESSAKPLGMVELENIFVAYFGFLLVIFIIFLLELLVWNLKKIKQRRI